MNAEQLRRIHIEPAQRRRQQRSMFLIFATVAALAGISGWLAWPRESDQARVFDGQRAVKSNPSQAPGSPLGDSSSKIAFGEVVDVGSVGFALIAG